MGYLDIYRYGPYLRAMTKTCKVCGVTDKDAEFYASMTNRCKECHKEKVRQNRKEKVEYYREYDKKRFQNDPKVKERHKRYQATEAGKASMIKARKKWQEQNPEKRAAHVLLYSRIRSGEVIKPEICEKCGSGGKIHGHHHDYTKPLDVVWLCPLCHAKEHAR